VTEIVSRSEWGARAPRSTASIGSVYGVTVHWNGPGLGTYRHSACAGLVRAMQDHHMDTNGWADIGYNALACRHGSIFEGRGLHVLGAHAGASNIGGNTHWYGLQGMVGSGDPITPDLLRGLKEAIGWFRANGAGSRVNGHRDHHATECPGAYLYRWAHSDLSIPPEGDVPEYVSVGASEPQPLKVGDWVSLTYDTEYADSEHQHANDGAYSSVLTGSAKFSLAADVRIAGAPTGTEFQARLVETDPAKHYEISKTYALQEFGATSGDTYFTLNQAVGYCTDDQHLYVQVKQVNGTTPGAVAATHCKVFFWR